MAVRNKKLNITLIGDAKVGKTSLLNSYLEHYFSKQDSAASLAYNEETENLFTKRTNIDGITHELFLCDTSSSTEHWVMETIYPKTDCFVICYAMNNANSFTNISRKWIPEIRRKCPNARMVIAGTKLDMKNCYGATRVSDLTIEKFKIRYKVDAVIESSSKTLEGVNQVFKEAVNSAYQSKHSACILM